MNKKQLGNIQKIMDEIISSGFTSGANCLIIHDGQEQGYFESGYADKENLIPMKRDSIFRMYSMSKTVTSVAVMILVEQGLIDLYDNVSKYIPSFANPSVGLADNTLESAEREIRIYDLMSMTSGIPYPNINSQAENAANDLMNEIVEKMDTADALSTVEIASRTGAHPLQFHPGSRWEYGFSADILGAIVEIASKMKYSDFLAKYIFTPLQMTDTAFFVPSDKIARLTKVYEDGESGLNLYTYPNLGISNHMSTKPKFESGGAGLVSTIDDFAKFARMLINNGEYNGTRILSKESIKYISTPTLTTEQINDFNKSMPHMQGYSYGNLMRVMTNPERGFCLAEKGEYGWDGWLGTYMAIDPVNKLIILLMQQKTNSGTCELTRKIKNAVYSSL